MSDEVPYDERSQVLAAIDQAIPTEPLPEEPLPAPEPVAEAMPEPLPEAMPEPMPEPFYEPPEEPVAERPLSSRALAAPLPPWMRHRHEIAGLVTAFVAIVWLAVGIAMGAWSPALLGALFAGGAACIKAYAPPI